MNRFPFFPVHIHVAKCAGTYSLSAASTLNKFFHEQNEENLKPGWKEKKRVRKALVDLENGKQLTICYYTGCDINESLGWKLADESNPYVDIVDEKSFLNEIKNNTVFVFSISINPVGIGFREAFDYINHIEFATKRSARFFMPVRSPLDRACSLFYYLSNEISKHEVSYNSIQSKNLRDYLINEYCDENYIIRSFLNLKPDQVICEKDALKVLDKSKGLESFDVRKIDELLNKVFEICYGLNLSMVNPENLNLNKNENKYKRSELQQFTESSDYKIFLEKNKFENMIYNELKSRSNFKLDT